MNLADFGQVGSQYALIARLLVDPDFVLVRFVGNLSAWQMGIFVTLSTGKLLFVDLDDGVEPGHFPYGWAVEDD